MAPISGEEHLLSIPSPREKMLLKPYMRPSPAFERGHWEATALEKAPVHDLLRDARQELARMAPATWA